MKSLLYSALAFGAILALMLIAVALRASTPQTGLAQSNVVRFPATGKELKGKFLEYWNSHGGLAQQGYPISDEFKERSTVDGREYTVQYFERSVFELHRENHPPYDVLLSLLGTARYDQRYVQHEPGTPRAPAPTPAHQARDTGGDWPMYGHDPQHTGYNPDESLIGPRNVAQVVPRWRVLVGSIDNPSSSTPSVAHGRVYVGSSVPS